MAQLRYSFHVKSLRPCSVDKEKEKVGKNLRNLIFMIRFAFLQSWFESQLCSSIHYCESSQRGGGTEVEEEEHRNSSSTQQCRGWWRGDQNSVGFLLDPRLR